MATDAPPPDVSSEVAGFDPDQGVFTELWSWFVEQTRDTLGGMQETSQLPDDSASYFSEILFGSALRQELSLENFDDQTRDLLMQII